MAGYFVFTSILSKAHGDQFSGEEYRRGLLDYDRQEHRLPGCPEVSWWCHDE
jgi:hypothetical protein